MSKQHFQNQFAELRKEKLRRRKRFLKHYEVKMRLKQIWYRSQNQNAKHSH
jgi:hypothetical protein